MRSVANAFLSVVTMASWPIRPSKEAGRYLRASTTYGTAFSPPSSGLPGSPGCFFFAMPAQCHPGEGGDPDHRLHRLWRIGFRRRRTAIWAGTEQAAAKWEADKRPASVSLGLLPSGPDPDGAGYVQ